MTPPKPTTIDAYIAGFPADIQKLLEQVRAAIRAAAPDAAETIKYGMPTFTLEGNLVYFAAYKNHVGFYPIPKGVEEFERELAPYRQGKGSVRFPLDQPLPLALVAEMVRFRVKSNLKKMELKRMAKAK